MTLRIASTSLALALLALPALADPAALYAGNCASCHGPGRLGATGPALIPETLGRMRGPDIAAVIAEGRTATQMPGFAGTLSAAEIAALATYVKTPLAEIPDWGTAEIAASLIPNPDYTPAEAPVFAGDPLDLFLVVEKGDHHLSILDGDSFARLARLPTPFAVHGGPKFSPDGRFAYVMARDGWVQKIDLWSLAEVARIRAGINSRNIAISRDGKWLAVANYLPRSLTILDARDLSVAKTVPVTGRDGTPSRVSAVYQAPPRDSFVLALKDVPEVWEIATDPDAGPFHEGFVHSYETGMVEALGAEQGLFARRRIMVEEPVDDFFFTPDYANLIGTTRDGTRAKVINLIVGREIAQLDLPGMPHLGSGIAWEVDGRMVLATPHLGEALISVIDTRDWRVINRIETQGPGFFLRSHEATPYLWAGVFFGPNRDAVHVIDKRTLEIVETLRPEPGATAAHVEFDREGEHALLSLWEDDGALIVYDAARLTVKKRIPMKRPAGKYNVWNKITFSRGTSH